MGCNTLANIILSKVQSCRSLGNLIEKIGEKVEVKFVVPLAKCILPHLEIRATSSEIDDLRKNAWNWGRLSADLLHSFHRKIWIILSKS